MNKHNEPAYAWVVVWAAFTSMAVIFGVAYSFAAFFQSFAGEFAAQRADVSLVFGLCGLVYFTGGVAGGLLADRFGPQRVCTAGMACIAAGLLATSFAANMATVYLTYGVGIGVGIALVYTPSMACVQPWFSLRRGLAAGTASAGIGAGTLVLPLAVAAAISALQWRNAMRALALAVLLLGCGATLLLRRAPVPGGAARGPTGVSSAAGTGSAAGASAGKAPAPPGMTLREALRSAPFWWLYLATVAAAPTMFIPFAHASATARDLGIAPAQAVGLVGLIGIGSLVGRFAIGSLADRLGRSRTLVLMQLSMGASYLLWWAAGSYASLVAFTLWFGLSYGGIVSLLPAMCMDFFGARAVASILGTLYSGAALGNLLGPVLAGAVFDRLGSYTPVMGACIALSAIATLASARLMGPRATNY